LTRRIFPFYKGDMQFPIDDELPATTDKEVAERLGLELLPETYYTLEEAAKYLGMRERALRDACLARRITYSKLDRRTWRFTKTALEDFIERNTKRWQPPSPETDLERKAPSPDGDGIRPRRGRPRLR
jgi:excisionase family DNA binding protein